MDIERQVRAHFPGAVGRQELTNRLVRRVWDCGRGPDAALVALCLCSDEVHHEWSELAGWFGAPFQMGGLAGVPFVGTTGMTAFAHHVPDGGAAVIVYGSHIGLAADGSLGRIQRRGQAAETSCCGALAGLLARFQAAGGEAVKADLNPIDIEQAMLLRSLASKAQRVVAAPQPLLALTELAYQLIAREMEAIIKSSLEAFHDRPILTMGGIVINTPEGHEDLFDVRDESLYDGTTPAGAG